jgi:hypothetical protein
MSIIRNWVEKGYDVQITKGNEGYYVDVREFNGRTWKGWGETLGAALRDADNTVRRG